MRIPEFREPGLSQFLSDQDRDIQRFKLATMSAVTANRALLLYSPSKMVFEITVDDAGVLHAVKVSG